MSTTNGWKTEIGVAQASLVSLARPCGIRWVWHRERHCFANDLVLVLFAVQYLGSTIGLSIVIDIIQTMADQPTFFCTQFWRASLVRNHFDNLQSAVVA